MQNDAGLFIRDLHDFLLRHSVPYSKPLRILQKVFPRIGTVLYKTTGIKHTIMVIKNTNYNRGVCLNIHILIHDKSIRLISVVFIECGTTSLHRILRKT